MTRKEQDSSHISKNKHGREHPLTNRTVQSIIVINMGARIHGNCQCATSIPEIKAMAKKIPEKKFRVNLIYPIDNIEMWKRWPSPSSKRKIQRWGCSHCGRATIKNQFGKVHDYPLAINDC